MIPLEDDSPATLRPIVTIGLILVCIAVLLWQHSLDAASARRAVDALGAVPAVLLGRAHLPADLQWIPRFTSPLTSMFLHGGWMHLLGNMLFLWIFGDNVEEAMGHWRFLAFYLLCGLTALGAQVLVDPASPYPIIGASGAISGVLGAYLLLFPRARILTLVLLPFFFTTVRIPAMLLLLLWFAAQLISGIAGSAAGAGIAFGAHIGGFIGGMLLVVLMIRREVRLFRV